VRVGRHQVSEPGEQTVRLVAVSVLAPVRVVMVVAVRVVMVVPAGRVVVPVGMVIVPVDMLAVLVDMVVVLMVCTIRTTVVVPVLTVRMLAVPVHAAIVSRPEPAGRLMAR